MRTAMLEEFDLFDILRRGARTLFGRRERDQGEKLETAQNIVAAVITAGVIVALVGLLVTWLMRG